MLQHIFPRATTRISTHFFFVGLYLKNHQASFVGLFSSGFAMTHFSRESVGLFDGSLLSLMGLFCLGSISSDISVVPHVLEFTGVTLLLA